jgi:hypothetical protein
MAMAIATLVLVNRDEGISIAPDKISLPLPNDSNIEKKKSKTSKGNDNNDNQKKLIFGRAG